MRRTYITGLLMLLCIAFKAEAQTMVPLTKGWKLSIGDSPEWSSPTFDDSKWQSADISKSWEKQGHPNDDGFGWYRIHIVIPSAIVKQSVFKDSLLFNLGYADDNDEVYLNGVLVAKYGNNSGTIKDWRFGPRVYRIATNNPAIKWDKENVLAIRIFDTSGDGGVYGTGLNIRPLDLMDGVVYDMSADINYGADNTLGRSIKITTKNHYNYIGKLHIKVTDPENNRSVYETTTPASFGFNKPFSYTFKFPMAKKSYAVKYVFTDDKYGKELTETETTPYILTPIASAKPKINGAEVFGARPGHSLLYLIPATGKKPLSYKVAGLPAGLKLNAATGVITGTMDQKGSYPVTFTVSNKLGSSTKKFTFIIGDDIGLTPALGWNSWNAWAFSVNDSKVRISAKQMSDKLSAHGWSYVNIDDGWEAPTRLADGRIAPNTKFPDMKALSDYIHGLGLHIGIYSSPGPKTCGGYVASWQHEDQDAQTYGEWGIDYLKYDWCSYSQVASPNPDLATAKKPYQVMRSALDKVNRDILFSFCQYGWNDVWKWGAETGGNSWRTTGDINDSWSSLSSIGFSQDKAAPYAQPGHFNDPDMLVVGKVGWGPSLHNTHLTVDEQYTHISLWSLLAAPLLIGCDMGQLDKFTLNLLTNDEVLAIDQDALGKSARQYIKTGDYQVWVKELKDGSKAIGLFNLTNEYKTLSLDKADPALNGYRKYRDVWRQQYIIAQGKALSAKVAPHGVWLIRIEK